MRPQQLRTLVAAVEAGSFTGAAQRLGMSQPGVSQHLHALERELGVRLFDRRGRVLVPTPAALELAASGEAFVRAWDDARAVAERLREPTRERLRVGASTTPGAYVLPAALRSFTARAPQVTLDATVADATEVLRLLRAGDLDVALVGELQRGEDDLVRTPFQRDELIAVWSPRSPLAALPRVRPRDLLAQPFVTLGIGDSTRQLTERWAAERGRTLEVRLELDTSEAVKQAVAADLGVGVVSDAAVQLELESGLLMTSEVTGFPLRRTIYLVIRRGVVAPASAAAFVRQLLGARRGGDLLRRGAHAAVTSGAAS